MRPTLGLPGRSDRLGLMLLPLVVFLVLLALASRTAGDNSYIQASLYQQVESEGSLRLLTQTASFGASGQNALTPGILYLLEDETDLSTFLSFNPALATFAVVLSFNLFNPTVLDQLASSKKVAGVIVIQESSVFSNVTAYSPDSTFPNFDYSLYANLSTPPHTWNPNGNGLLQKSYGFPIFYVGLIPTDTTWPRNIGGVIEAAQYNKDKSYVNYPLYGVEFDDFMWASFDVVTCLRREGVCDVLGGNTVWASSDFNMTSTDNKDVIIVASNSSWGVATTTSSYVTLLSVAQALSTAPVPMSQLNKTLIFAAFQAEQLGFSGSKRFVQDLVAPFQCLDQSGVATNGCPYDGYACNKPCFPATDFTRINFDRISAIVEFDQVSGVGLADPDNASLFMHVDDSTDANTLALAQQFVGNVSVSSSGSTSRKVTVKEAWSDGVNRRLPPSSAMSFLAKKKIPAVVFGDYQDTYTNAFYNAELDDSSRWNASHTSIMCGLATISARGLFKLAGGNATAAQSISANCTLVAELFDCFSRNLTCSLFQKFYTANVLVASQFPGSYSLGSGLPYIPYYINVLLWNYTAVDNTGFCSTDNGTDTCAQSHGSNYTCLAGMCIKALISEHPAYGTGLSFDVNSGSAYVSDSGLPTYVVSMYASLGRRMRIYMSSSVQYDAVTLVVGVGLTGLTVGLVFFVQRLLGNHLKND
ncbi:hypothetical protein HK405_002013 [Cladochytrium tenue]|nr:hypothetical protein HK405_002013 [Cladochytrium tenue]